MLMLVLILIKLPRLILSNGIPCLPLNIHVCLGAGVKWRTIFRCSKLLDDRDHASHYISSGPTLVHWGQERRPSVHGDEVVVRDDPANRLSSSTSTQSLHLGAEADRSTVRSFPNPPSFFGSKAVKVRDSVGIDSHVGFQVVFPASSSFACWAIDFR